MEEKTKLSDLIPVESIQKMQSALKELETISSVEIKNNEEYSGAAEMQITLKRAIKDIESDRKETVLPFNEKVKAINEKFKSVMDRLDNGVSKIGSAMIEWKRKEDLRIAEERRIAEAKAEEARRKAEAAAQKELEKAQAYRDQGREEMAEKAEARAETKSEEAISVVAPEIEKQKVPGISYRSDFSIEVIDKEAAIPAMLANPAYADFVIIDEKGLNRMVKAVKGKMLIPGIVVTEKKIQVVRS